MPLAAGAGNANARAAPARRHRTARGAPPPPASVQETVTQETVTTMEPDGKKEELRLAIPAAEPSRIRPNFGPVAATTDATGASLLEPGLTPPSRLSQHQHAQLLESMDRTARELCDDTRRQYELLLQRQEAQFERQLQATQHKLREVVSSSISLGEHRQALKDLSRTHESDMQALVKLHDNETATVRMRSKQIANEHQLRCSRAFQDEKEFLLDKMTQLELDRNDALRQWRDEELAVLSARKDLEDALHEKLLSEGKLQEACQHMVALKSQLLKLDRLSKKVKVERAAQTLVQDQLQRKLLDACETKAELSKRVSILETEMEHWRSTCQAQQDELANGRSAAMARDGHTAELQRALTEATTKESLLREFRESERRSFEQDRSEWRAAQERLESYGAEMRHQCSALQHEKQAFERQCQLLTAEVVRLAAERTQSESRWHEKVQASRTKCARAKQRLAQLEATNAELQDEERVNQLLFNQR